MSASVITTLAHKIRELSLKRDNSIFVSQGSDRPLALGHLFLVVTPGG